MQPTDVEDHLLGALATVRQRFIETSIVLRSRPGIHATRNGFDCRAYASGTTLEWYLEADVVGRTVCWSLDAMRKESGWDISPAVLENRASQDGQELLRGVRQQTDVPTALLTTEFLAATDALLATTELREMLEVTG
jgi:hypothetical protein